MYWICELDFEHDQVFPLLAQIKFKYSTDKIKFYLEVKNPTNCMHQTVKNTDFDNSHLACA